MGKSVGQKPGATVPLRVIFCIHAGLSILSIHFGIILAYCKCQKRFSTLTVGACLSVKNTEEAASTP
jgi:hypothetical protein